MFVPSLSSTKKKKKPRRKMDTHVKRNYGQYSAFTARPLFVRAKKSSSTHSHFPFGTFVVEEHKGGTKVSW
jgi:hypothetical protein